jgi:uncharacterized protein
MRISPSRLVPVLDDRDTSGFFQAAQRHELVVRVCTRCHTVLHLPRSYCSACGGSESRWQSVPGRGKLYSWTTVEQPLHPAYPVPYTIILVQLDEPPGVRLVGCLSGAPDLTEGQAMQVHWEECDGGVVLPQWKPQ